MRIGDCAAGALVNADANCGLVNFEDSRAADKSSKLAGTEVTLLSTLGAKESSPGCSNRR